jgi:hypothetical protein
MKTIRKRVEEITASRYESNYFVIILENINSIFWNEKKIGKKLKINPFCFSAENRKPSLQ